MDIEKEGIDIINIMIVERQLRMVEIEKNIENIEIDKIKNKVEGDFQQVREELLPRKEGNNSQINKIDEQIEILKKEDSDLNSEIINLEIMRSM